MLDFQSLLSNYSSSFAFMHLHPPLNLVSLYLFVSFLNPCNNYSLVFLPFQSHHSVIILFHSSVYICSLRLISFSLSCSFCLLSQITYHSFFLFFSYHLAQINIIFLSLPLSSLRLFITLGLSFFVSSYLLSHITYHFCLSFIRISSLRLISFPLSFSVFILFTLFIIPCLNRFTRSWHLHGMDFLFTNIAISTNVATIVFVASTMSFIFAHCYSVVIRRFARSTGRLVVYFVSRRFCRSF